MSRPLRIAYIAAGAGSMFCGSCIRDNTLVKGLRQRGHEAVLLPIYTPLRTDEESVAQDRLFFGAINIYLQQKSQLFARLPGPLRRLLDSPRLLRRIGASGSSTDPRLLGELALSMLRGERGNQRAPLEQLVSWLRDSFRPEVIQLTNSMLLGLARRLKQELPEARLVTALQGEDLFLDELREPYRSWVLEELGRRAADCDLFLATSEFYADAMSPFLGIARDRIRVTRLGISLDALEPASPVHPPWTIGYLGRICPEKGLHLLVDAVRELAKRRGAGWVRLRVAGYLGGRDRKYFAELQERVDKWGLSSRVEWLGEVDRQGKIDFLRSLHALSMPTVYREPKGLPVLEAMACGVPVVQPAHGSFPEIVERTGGGVLVAPNDPLALADGLESLLADPERRRRLGDLGRLGVRQHHSADAMTDDTLVAYREVLGAADRGARPVAVGAVEPRLHMARS